MPVCEAVNGRATGRDVQSLTIRCRPPIAHQTNHLYDVWVNDQQLIDKVYLGNVERNSQLTEYRSLQVVRPLDIAPRPVFFDPSAGPVVGYEFLDGEMWDRRLPSASELEILANVWSESTLYLSTGCGSGANRRRRWRQLSSVFAHPSKRHECASRRWSVDWLTACRSSLK